MVQVIIATYTSLFFGTPFCSFFFRLFFGMSIIPSGTPIGDTKALVDMTRLKAWQSLFHLGRESDGLGMGWDVKPTPVFLKENRGET